MKNFVLFVLLVLCGFSAEARRVGVFYFFADDGKLIYEDENIRVEIGVSDSEPYLFVSNKTDHVIFIDKGSSFVYENGGATCLFSNASYSSGTGSGGGASVNLGGVANALGVGGAVGSILGGVNVGGGRSTQNSTTYYEQRVKALAPHASYKLYEWDGTIYYYPKRPWKPGRKWSFGRNDSPYVIEASLRYSADESFTSVQTAEVSNYVSDRVYGKVYYAKRNYLYGPYCSSFAGRNGMCKHFGTANGLWIYLGATVLIGTTGGIIGSM